jgi:hypothetical protein
VFILPKLTVRRAAGATTARAGTFVVLEAIAADGTSRSGRWGRVGRFMRGWKRSDRSP